jgi:hypothetical protein
MFRALMSVDHPDKAPPRLVDETRGKAESSDVSRRA